MAKLLVIKSLKGSHSDMGWTIPVGIEGDDGVVRGIEEDEFPNNNMVFISKEYSKIEEGFKDGEIFFLNSWHVSEDEEWRDNLQHQKYYSRGIWASRTEMSTYLPIIKMSMPDISTGLTDDGFDIPANNSPFFILNNDIVAGPFLATKEDDCWLLSPTAGITPLNLPPHHVAQFTLSDLRNSGLLMQNSALGEGRLILTSLRKAAEIEYDTQDYISDSGLIRYYSKNGFGKGVSSITKSEASKLSLIIDSYRKKSKVLDNNERLKRLESTLGEYLRFQGFGKDIVENFLFETKLGKQYLDEYVGAHKDFILKERNDEIDQQVKVRKERHEKELAEIGAKIEVKKFELSQVALSVEQERKNAERKIQEIKQQTQEEAEKVLLQKREDLSIENTRLEDDIKKNQLINDDLISTNSNLKDIGDLQLEKGYIARAVDDVRSELEKYQRYAEKQRALISSPDIAENLIQHKTLLHMLNGISSESNDSDIKPIALRRSSVALVDSLRKDFINGLRARFDKELGRSFSYDEMANLVICTMQSFITILAGPPGTGKTSTALRYSDAMYLSNPEPAADSIDGFLSISVGRGWVATRDMLGFYNSLKNAYQPSRTGLYQYLRSVGNSPDKNLNLVLLDEANLSNIEHYWSDFLGMCDLYDKGSRIDLGITDLEKRYLYIPDSLRFIATINNDATTERLSPRLVDRAPVITLGHVYEDMPSEYGQVIFDGAIPYGELKQAFCVTADEADLEGIDKVRLDQIIDVLSSSKYKAAPVFVSNRKVNAIKKYCYIAQELDYETASPLDYAVSQHVLPLIYGYGSGFKERLVSLEKMLDEWDFNLSKKLLQDVIETGDGFADSYSFF